jgi:hypothetical protein
VEYLVKELNFTEEEALKSTREEYGNLELMKHFKDYAEQQVVLVLTLVHKNEKCWDL